MATKRTVLVEKVLMALQGSTRVRTLIAASMGISVYTVSRWVKHNDPYLCLPDAMKVIMGNISIPEGESYTQEVEMGDKHLAVN